MHKVTNIFRWMGGSRCQVSYGLIYGHTGLNGQVLKLLYATKNIQIQKEHKKSKIKFTKKWGAGPWLITLSKKYF